jgi:inner membrane protein
MPTIFTHSAVPLAMALGAGDRIVSRRMLVAGMALSILPDLDVIAFRFGVPYAAEFGHRGFSHSLFFAVATALCVTALCPSFRASFLRSFTFLFLAVVSHGVLDACTDGGLGIAVLWPWSNRRFFVPVKFIEVSPITFCRFFSPRGLAVLRSELATVWLPLMGLASVLALVRRWYVQKASRY